MVRKEIHACRTERCSVFFLPAMLLYYYVGGQSLPDFIRDKRGCMHSSRCLLKVQPPDKLLWNESPSHYEVKCHSSDVVFATLCWIYIYSYRDYEI